MRENNRFIQETEQARKNATPELLAQLATREQDTLADLAAIRGNLELQKDLLAAIENTIFEACFSSSREILKIAQTRKAFVFKTFS